MPDLDVFSQGLVTRESGGWKISDKGRTVLEFMEASGGVEQAFQPAPAEAVDATVPPLPPQVERAKRRRERRERRREGRERTRATAS